MGDIFGKVFLVQAIKK